MEKMGVSLGVFLLLLLAAMDEQNNPTESEQPREQVPPDGGPEVPKQVLPVAEEPEPPVKQGSQPTPAPKAPPKPPSQEASSGSKTKPRQLRPSDPSQSDIMEPISWDCETKAQRTTTVALEDFLSSTPVSCGLVDQRIINTVRNGNAIAAFRAVMDVCGPNQEIFHQEAYYSGPRIGAEYESVVDLNPTQGSFGDAFPTLSSTPIAENTLIRALRGTTSGADAIAGGAFALWSPSRSEAVIRAILTSTGLVNTASLLGYQWTVIMVSVLATRYYGLRYPTAAALAARVDFVGNFAHNQFAIYPGWMALNAYEQGLGDSLKGSNIFIHATESEIIAFGYTVLFLTRARFQYQPLANQVHAFIGSTNALEVISVTFISLDTPVMRPGPAIVGPGGAVPGGAVPESIKHSNTKRLEIFC